MPHETLLKFNYPHTLLREYRHWAVLLRPKQVTVGSLVLVCTEDVTRLPEVSPEAFGELPRVTADLEGVLQQAFAFDKINYLLLMMVDRHVHFHVIPRYAGLREACGVTFADLDWPKPADVTKTVDLTEPQFAALLTLVKGQWLR
jgi:diadenosine tetraphosphate (Ap4A) HIT family hydrolase